MTENHEHHLNMLGKPCLDSLSGLRGDAVMIGYDFDGTTQVLLQPKVLEDNKLPERQWVNISRVKVL